jgi:hypothetical protein
METAELDSSVATATSSSEVLSSSFMSDFTAEIADNSKHTMVKSSFTISFASGRFHFPIQNGPKQAM